MSSLWGAWGDACGVKEGVLCAPAEALRREPGPIEAACKCGVTIRKIAILRLPVREGGREIATQPSYIHWVSNSKLGYHPTMRENNRAKRLWTQFEEDLWTRPLASWECFAPRSQWGNKRDQIYKLFVARIPCRPGPSLLDLLRR